MMHTIAAKAVAFGEALKPEFSEYGHIEWLKMRGHWPGHWKTAGLRIVSGGTDNHLMLVDLTSIGHHRQGS